MEDVVNTVQNIGEGVRGCDVWDNDKIDPVGVFRENSLEFRDLGVLAN